MKQKRQLYKVEQLYNKNQFMIHSNNMRVFQSYNSVVAIYNTNTQKLILGRDWDYSHTTLKHLYLFIGDYCIYEIASILNAKNKKQAIIKAIKSKIIKYDPTLR